MNDSVSVLAFADSQRQIDDLRLGEAVGGACAVATTVLEALEDVSGWAGRCFNLWEFLDERAAARNRELAWSFCSSLAKALEGDVVVAGCDIAAQAQNDLLHAAVYALNSATVVAAAMDRLCPATVVHFAEMRHAPFWDQPEYPRDVFNAIVAFCAAERNLPCRVLESASASAGGKAPPCRPPPFVRAASEEGHLSFCTGPHDSFREQWELLRLVSRREPERWLVVTPRAIPLDLPQILVKHLLKLPWSSSAFGSVDEIGRTVCSAVSRLAGFPLVLTRNQFLDFVWRDHASWMADAATHYLLGRLLGLAGSKGVVQSYDVFGFSKCFRESISEAGIPVVSVHHGGLDFLSTLARYRGCRGAIALWNETERESLHTYGAGKTRTHIVGSLRADHGIARTEESATTHGTGSPPRVVLFTGQVSVLHAVYGDPVRHRLDVMALGDLAARRQDILFTIKTHPAYDYYALYERVAASCRNVTCAGTSARDTLSGASVAILFNLPSSVALDAMALRVPVVYYKGAVFESEPTVVELGGCVLARSMAELEAVVDRLMQDQLFARQTVQEQQMFRRRALAAVGEDAGERMLSAVRAMVSRNADGVVRSGPAVCQQRRAVHWLLDMIMFIQGVHSGQLQFARPGGGPAPAEKCGWREKLAELRLAGQQARFDGLDMLDVPRLGEYLLRLAVWGERAQGASHAGPWLPGFVWLLYSSTPSPLRPGVKGLRSFLNHALEQDAREHPGSAVRRVLARLLPPLVAPGRLFARRRHRDCPRGSGLMARP